MAQEAVVEEGMTDRAIHKEKMRVVLREMVRQIEIWNNWVHPDYPLQMDLRHAYMKRFSSRYSDDTYESDELDDMMDSLELMLNYRGYRVRMVKRLKRKMAKKMYVTMSEEDLEKEKRYLITNRNRAMKIFEECDHHTYMCRKGREKIDACITKCEEFHKMMKWKRSEELLERAREALEPEIADDEEDRNEFNPDAFISAWWDCDHGLTKEQRDAWWGLDMYCGKLIEGQRRYGESVKFLRDRYGSVERSDLICEEFMNMVNSLGSQYANITSCRTMYYRKANTCVMEMEKMVDHPKSYVKAWIDYVGNIGTAHYLGRSTCQKVRKRGGFRSMSTCDREYLYRVEAITQSFMQNTIMRSRNEYSMNRCDETRRQYIQDKKDAMAHGLRIADRYIHSYSRDHHGWIRELRWLFRHDGIHHIDPKHDVLALPSGREIERMTEWEFFVRYGYQTTC